MIRALVATMILTVAICTPGATATDEPEPTPTPTQTHDPNGWWPDGAHPEPCYEDEVIVWNGITNTHDTCVPLDNF